MGVRLSTSRGVCDGSTARPQFHVELTFVACHIELIIHCRAGTWIPRSFPRLPPPLIP